MTTPAQLTNCFSLHSELCTKIFSYVLENEGHLLYRSVCKSFSYSINNVIKSRWLSLIENPPVGPFDVSLAIAKVQKPFLKEDGTLKENLNYLHLFRKLIAEWKKEGVTISEGEEIKSSYHHFVEFQDELNQKYQKSLEFSLAVMWGRIWPHIHLLVEYFSDATPLRKWLHDDRSEWIRLTIHAMDLSGLEIRYLPIEICCFSNLKYLGLNQNLIAVFPSFLKDQVNLETLNLKNNAIEELPENFPNWTHLHLIDLRGNPLSKTALALIDKWKENVKNSRSDRAQPIAYT